MSYVLVRVFQRYSGLELVEDSPTYDPRFWFRINDEPSLAEKFVNSRVQMASEISLAPKYPMNVKFLQ
jgi:hypothetical protein